MIKRGSLQWQLSSEEQRSKGVRQMLLEEAIKHCEEKALCGDACGLEHKQLADWLRKLIKVNAKLEESESMIAEKDKEITKLKEQVALLQAEFIPEPGVQ